MEEVFLSYGLDVIGKAVFNYDFGSLKRKDPVIEVDWAGAAPSGFASCLQASSLRLFRCRMLLLLSVFFLLAFLICCFNSAHDLPPNLFYYFNLKLAERQFPECSQPRNACMAP